MFKTLKFKKVQKTCNMDILLFQSRILTKWYILLYKYKIPYAVFTQLLENKQHFHFSY